MKKIFDKKIVLSFIAGAVMFMVFSVNADITYNADGVLYKKGNSNVVLTDVIDDLKSYFNYGNATADNITKGKTAIINGKKVTGTYSNTATYTFAEESTGDKEDLGEDNNFRYVDATNVYDKGFKDGLKKGLDQAAGIKIASGVSSFSQAYSIPGVTLTTNNFSYRIVRTDARPCTWTDSWGGHGTVSAPGAPGPSLTYSNGVLTLGNTTASHYDYNGNDGSGCTARTTVYVDIYCNYSSGDVN